MKLKILAMLVATSLGTVALCAEPELASGKEKAAAAGAGNIDKAIALAPKGLRFGMSLEAVAKLYDKVLEEEYKPLFLKAGNSPESLTIEEELKSKQAVLRRSRVDFGMTPTGIDQSPLKGEYSYRNGESLARLTLRSGTQRNLFFFSDKLWKVYDEHKLAKGGALGESFDEAVKVLSKRFGAEPKKIPADYTKGQNFDEAVWRDPEKIIRAVDRGNVLGMVYVDKSVQDNLAQYRKNKEEDQHAIDKDVAAATANPPQQVRGPQEDKDKAAKDAKKKK